MRQGTVLLRRAVAQSRPYPRSTRLTPFLKNTLPRIRSPLTPRRNIPSVLGARFQSSLTVPESEKSQETEKPVEPSYQLTFTCKPCKHRSSHRITKHGYHRGTVLIQCPSCKNRHVISDHLKIFMDEASTLEDILQRTAGTDGDVLPMLKKGQLGRRQGQLIGNEHEQDVEFWDDGTTSKHSPN